MSAAEDLTPPTSRSGKAPSVAEPAPLVVVDSAATTEAMRAVMPSTSRHVSVRVDRRLRNTKAYMMPKNERLVLRTLAGHAGYDDKCYPSVPTVADECGMSEATARAAIRSLIARGWLFVSDNQRRGPDGERSSNEYTLTPDLGEWWPEDARTHLARQAPQARRDQSGSTPPANGATTLVSPSDTTSNGETGVVSSGATTPLQTAQPPWYQAAQQEEPMEAPNEEPMEAPIARVSAGARTCETGSTTMPLFREAVHAPPPEEPKPRRQAPKPSKPPKASKPPSAPKASEGYSAAYVAGQIDAEPGCGFTPLSEPDCRLVGMAAAAHAKDPTTGEPITGERLLAWIRKTSADFRRAADPAFSKGFSAHCFVTWLNASRPKTRKVPLPKPPEPPQPKREIPPPEPIPEMFLKLAAEDAERGVMLPFLRNRRPPENPQ